MQKMILLLAAALMAPLSLSGGADGDILTTAIRNGDTATLQRELAAGGNPNAVDASGTTPLMLAAAYGSERDLALLIDAGAQVNHANTYGSTALMWAAGDAAKVRLLVDKGATVTARAVDRTTPLLAAARRGNIEAMRLLMARGASPNAVAADATNLLRTAYIPYRQSVVSLLAEHGVALKASDITPPMLITNINDAAVVRQLLELGADPNLTVTQATLTVPALGFAASVGNRDVLRVLAERGARVDDLATHKYTPLMMAAAAINASPEVIGFLVGKGADVHARDDAGRTALDWALLQGETAVVKALRAAGARAMVSGAPSPAAVARPRAARDAVERAVARLQPTSPVFFERTQCISCHQQSLPAMAAKFAMDRGVTVDRTLAAHPTAMSLATWRGQRDQFLLGNPAFPGFTPAVGYALMAMHAEGAPPTPESDAAALLLASLQQPDGSWRLPPGGAGIRPPLDAGSHIHLTATVLGGLATYMPPSRKAETSARLARARDFLRQATPHDTQDEVFKLLGLTSAGGARSEIAAAAARLRALQRDDGGWAQLPTLRSDAYATGQALYALHVSGLPATAPEYRRGVEYLLRTQLEDGTWFVQSRAFGFQPYFETGFPHGRSQFISSAATAWAAIALTLSL